VASVQTSAPAAAAVAAAVAAPNDANITVPASTVPSSVSTTTTTENTELKRKREETVAKQLAEEKKATEEAAAAKKKAEEDLAENLGKIMEKYIKYDNEAPNSVVAGKKVKKQVLITNLNSLITELNNLKLSYQTTGIDTSNIDNSIITIRTRINELSEVYSPTRGGTRKHRKNLRKTRKNRK
jgi:hypothetical protein